MCEQINLAHKEKWEFGMKIIQYIGKQLKPEGVFTNQIQRNPFTDM